MTDERIIPLPADGDRPTFTVSIEGEAIAPETHVASLLVKKSYNKIASATLVIFDGEADAQDFPASNSEVFVPGKEVEIAAGYHSQEDVIFKGIIISQGLRVRKNKPAQLIVECKDPSVKAATTRRSAYHIEVKDSDVMESILGEYGVETEVEATEETHQEMVQYYATDWDFVLTRAEANGKLVFTDDGKVIITAPEISGDAALSLNFGSTLLEFEAVMDSREQIPAAKSVAWDYSSQEVIEEEGDDPGLEEAGNLSASDLSDVMEMEALEQKHPGKVSDQELKSWSDARVYRSRLAKILGRVRCQGYAGVKPGSVLELTGVGERYNGKHLITGVRHQLNTENWETDIQFGMPTSWLSDNNEVTAGGASGMLPGVRGLHVGVVKQLQDDPDGEDRVLVVMPMIDPEGEGVWARVATLDAGENRGSFFRPEIEDEVILGFLNEDPRDPIILGMLNSSAKPAPLAASDDNHEKGFVTRSEMKMIFDDDKVSYTLETPNGNKVVLSEDEGSIVVECENGNKFELTSDGITLDSPGDINITAAGDVNIEGTNCNVVASAEVKAEGSGGAKLSTSAVATIEGSLVQIN